MLDAFGRAAADQAGLSPSRWRATYVALIDDLRKAIAWTVHASADLLLGIQLVAAGLPLWHELSLDAEIRDTCRRALAEFRRLGCSDTALELRLVAVSRSNMNVRLQLESKTGCG